MVVSVMSIPEHVVQCRVVTCEQLNKFRAVAESRLYTTIREGLTLLLPTYLEARDLHETRLSNCPEIKPVI